MDRLPFQIDFPLVTIGNPEIGEMQLFQFKDLTPKERVFVQSQLEGLPNLKHIAARMAEPIAQQLGCSIVTVYNGLLVSDTELLGNYVNELLEFERHTDQVVRLRPLVMALAMLKLRYCQTLKAQGDLRTIAHVERWELADLEDCDKIHPGLVQALVAFAHQEEAGIEAPKPITEAEVKKPSTRRRNQKQTGQISSTASNGCGEDSNVSPLPTLAISQAG